MILHGDRIRAEPLNSAPDGTWPDSPEVCGADARVPVASTELTVTVAAFHRFMFVTACTP